MINDLEKNKTNLIVFVFVVFIIGAFALIYVSLTNQINTLQINEKLITDHFTKDVEEVQNHILNIQVRRDIQWSQNAIELKEINNKITDLKLNCPKK